MVAKKRSTGSSAKSSPKKQKKEKPTQKQKQTQKTEELISIDRIKSLHNQFNESTKHLNNIAELLKSYDFILKEYKDGSDSDKLNLSSRFLSLTLQKIFSKLISENEFKLSKSSTDQKKQL
ncbi:unnamed protein product [Ambrosiozyma monospora]|uniref:Unnamed protein product n=1 Tax=Ambrosiozyma monospora TaxID=43982 RepID=A0ACB5U1G0_AMBMO|nr:unnamed protein product [Ambrosiozyma monospora]